MAALSIIGTTLNRQDLTPLTQNTGANSKSDPNAGASAPKDPTGEHEPIKTGDKVAAAFLTIVTGVLVIAGAIFLVY